MGKTSYLNFLGEISEESAARIMEVCIKEVSEKNAEEIYFMLSSPGGEVGSGIALYNFLKGLPARVVMHNLSNVDSIATIAFLAGERRYAVKEASFLFHKVKHSFQDKGEMSIADLEEVLVNMKNDEANIAKIIQRETSISPKEIQSMQDSGRSRNAKYAKEKGVIHAIKECRFGKDEPVINIK